MPNPTAAMLVIGDEILSGRTRDANMHHMAGRLTEAGFVLREARVIGDDHGAIVAAVRELSGAHDQLFTSGGIGPTHDDITADAVADAMGAAIGVREDALAILTAYYAQTGTELNEARLRMARIPEGADLIENPVSGAPGFSLGNVHVMAGVPKIFEAMVTGLLPRLTGGAPVLSRTLRVARAEGDLAAALGALAEAHSGISFGSYPTFSADGPNTRLVARGTDEAALEAAFAALRVAFPEGSA